MKYKIDEDAERHIEEIAQSVVHEICSYLIQKLGSGDLLIHHQENVAFLNKWVPQVRELLSQVYIDGKERPCWTLIR